MPLSGLTKPEVTPKEEGRKPRFLGPAGAAALMASTGRFLVFVAISVTALLSLGPLVLPYRTFIVVSGSMAPAISTGSLVIDRQVDAGTIRVGDTISFPRPDHHGEMVTHRVVRITATSFITKGDANSTADTWTVPIVGRVAKLSMSIPLVGYPLGWARTPAGIFLLFTLIAMYLVVGALRRLWASETIPGRGQPISPRPR